MSTRTEDSLEDRGKDLIALGAEHTAGMQCRLLSLPISLAWARLWVQSIVLKKQNLKKKKKKSLDTQREPKLEQKFEKL